MHKKIMIVPIKGKPRLQIIMPNWNKEFALWLPERLQADSNRLVFAGMDLHWTTGAEVSGKWVSPRIEDNQISLFIICKAKTDSIDLTVKIQNLGTKKWQGIGEVMACFQKTDTIDFVDTDGTRTYVITEKGLIRTCELSHFRPGKMLDGVDAEQMKNILASQLFQNTLIMTTAEDESRTVGFAWDISDRISANFSTELNCIHSNVAILELKPGEEETRLGKIYFFEGGPQELYKQYLKDYEQWQSKRGVK